MATINKRAWLRNDSGDVKPLRILIPVEVGSSYTFHRGDICKVGKNTAGYAAAAASGDTSGLVVADEEQKAGDVARMLPFIVPRPEDLFEFALTAARAVVLGDPLAIGADAQTLTYTIAGTNQIGRIASDDNCPLPAEKSVTRRSVAKARMYFDENASYFAQVSGNS